MSKASVTVLRRERLGSEVIREVQVLFPRTETHPTPEQLHYYRSLGPYAFAIDRQSLHTEMRRKGFTGLQRRVSAIMAEGRDHFGHEPYFLPEPVPVPDPPDGVLPYVFDDRHWFVDGTTQRATGYAASQNARPRLWDAYLLALGLARHGCPPTAFLVGEATRLFRNEEWLVQFTNALWEARIRLFIAGFGEVTREIRPGLIAMINALSGWLGKITLGMREVHKRNHQLYYKRLVFGFMRSECKSRVLARPDQHPILREMIRVMAFREVHSQMEAARWLRLNYGIIRSHSWVSKVLRSPLLDGVYMAYDKHHIARKRQQKGTWLFDLDITPSGNRRYLVQPCEGLPFEIEYPAGTEPIPPEWVHHARRAVCNQRGRPPIHTPREDVLVPFRLLRCAICQHGIGEVAPAPGRRDYHWRLKCHYMNYLRKHHTMNTEELRAAGLIALPHVVEVRGRASDAVWSRLWQALQAHPVDPNEALRDPSSERHRLERTLEAVQREYGQFQERVFQGEFGDPADPTHKAWIDAKRQELAAKVLTAQREVETCSMRLLTQQRGQIAWQEAAAAVADLEEAEIPLALRKNIIAQIVDRVELNLETGAFVIHGALDIPFLQGLTGQVENLTNPRIGSIFSFALSGTILAAQAA